MVNQLKTADILTLLADVPVESVGLQRDNAL
jgi:hypothetical protein